MQALIVIGTLSLNYLKMLRNLKLPVVQVGDYHLRSGIDTVVSDDYYGMYTMTDYLLQRGHRAIAYLGQVMGAASITDRYFGYCRALYENGITVKKDWTLSDRDDNGNWKITLPEEMPTAFVCSNGMAANYLIRQLTERGQQVPDDISVVCFDDCLFSELTSPKVTSYSVDLDRMAQTSVERLCRNWHGQEAGGSFPRFVLLTPLIDPFRQIPVYWAAIHSG